MDVHDIYQLLTETVRQGPGYVVAYGLGLLTLAILWFSVHWFARRPLWGIIRQQEQHLDHLRQEAIQRSLDCARLESHLSHLKEETDQRLRERQSLQAEANALREAKAHWEALADRLLRENQALRQDHDAIQITVAELRESGSALRAVYQQAVEEKENLRAKHRALCEELEARKQSEQDLSEQVAELADQVQRLADFDGKVWEKTPGTQVPAFVPAAERTVRIIALSNLKGGVGKTTLTANLGATLAASGKRVLVVDLDYQGSLTSLCLSRAEINDIRRKGFFVDRLLHDFPIDPDLFAQCCHRLTSVERVYLLAADGTLADVENQVMARWLLDPDQGDARYILRAYLHQRSVNEQFDYVLLDCPPRQTTACMNALAAADAVLIPVLLDQTSAKAVPRQLLALRILKQEVCPDLDVLGVVANRTFPRKELIHREKLIWDALNADCSRDWGSPVPVFNTVIRQHAGFAEAASRNRLAVWCSPEVHTMFQDLAHEVLARIAPYERQSPPTVPSESGSGG